MSENVLIFITNILSSLFGGSMYKQLRSRPNLLRDLTRVWNTIKKLIKAKNKREIITGVDTYGDYEFFESPLFTILSIKGLVFSEEYVYNAQTDDDYLLCRNHLDKFIEKYPGVFEETFDWDTLFRSPRNWDEKKDGVYFDKLLESFKDDDYVLTALEWNQFWGNMLKLSSSSLPMKPLDVIYVTLNQVTGLVNTEDAIATCEVQPEFESVHFFKNSTREYPVEVSIICGLNHQIFNYVNDTVGINDLDELKMSGFNPRSYLFPVE